MNIGLRKLITKREVDRAIKGTVDKVLVLRFGEEADCLRIDDILNKAAPLLSRMAEVYAVEPHSVPVYTRYFDVTITPATVFFFNGQHIKIESSRLMNLVKLKECRPHQVCRLLQDQAGCD
ncbi:thioredoxin-like protein 4B [Dermacentor albipictus]|uniref:thioredoxin-like protein 4B n=1 Tax=Dermacentor albipictus TaxID=60249 RepID=UPI0031FCB609